MDFINIVSPQYIRAYLDLNFKGCGKYSSNEQEYIMPSIFEEGDWKHKFSINTTTGMWQDFKAHRQGNFIQFVAQTEQISFRRAESKILFDSTMEEYEVPLKKQESTSSKLEVDTSSWVPIDIYSCNHRSTFIQLAWKYLWERKLFNVEFVEDEPFYFATDGKYKDRIIIPFKKPCGEIYFFQARAVFNDYPKYLNPESTQVKASSVLYPFESDVPVLLCEGPLDALSLRLAGINATATMGSSPSKIQLETIKEMNCDIVIAYDNDDAGKRGIEKLERMRKELMMPSIKICPPPKAYKDWNEAWEKDFDLKTYVKKNTQDYDIGYLVNTNVESW
jgi:DNA primase